MTNEAFKLARDTLRIAVKGYGWTRKRSVWHGESRTISRTHYSYGPGKFEGEHWAIVHYYDALMNGDGKPLYDGESCIGTVLDVEEEERAAFGFGEDIDAIVIWHSEQGFETMQELTEHEVHDLHVDYTDEPNDERDES